MESAVEEASSSISLTDAHIPTVSAPTITGSLCTLSNAVSSTSDLLHVPPLPHHTQQPLCLSRPRYRQGRRLTAIKAYTISDESVYILITGVPGLKIQRELKNLCLKFGKVLCVNRVADYPVEPFDEAYLVKYGTVREARFAKKMLDGKNFFGGVFHVCYAPELESIDETRGKLEERRRAVQFALRKQEREKKRLGESEAGGGSVLCEYHPDDKLATTMNLGSKGSHSNLNNGLDADHQFDISFQNDAESCVSTQSSDNSIHNCSMSHTMAGKFKSLDATKNQIETDSHLQNSFLYTVPPPFFPCAGTASYNSESSQVSYVSKTSAHQTNNNHSNYSLLNPLSSPNYAERLSPKLDTPTKTSWESSSATTSVGQQYASMSSDYEPGLGRTDGERYVASTKRHKRNGFTHKATLKSFTIKPTKAYAKRKAEATCDEKSVADGASKPRLGYRQVVQSLQQQRSCHGDGQLARLQQALQATLGAPTAQDNVVPAPNRPTPKMKILTQGVKLI